jgi:hypothetical protein
MSYRVDYFRDGQVSGSEEVISFEGAKLLAVDAVDMDTADRAEVIGPDGKVLFRRPRTVAAAP